MPTKAKRPRFKSGLVKLDLHKRVTEAILARLKAGTVPWRKPWDTKVGAPRNYVTKAKYQGVNVLLLGSQNFASPYWMTYLQTKSAGGKIKRHARGSVIVKWGTSGKQATDTTEDEAGDEATNGKPRRFLRIYHVFNLTQIEGIEAGDKGTPEQPNPNFIAAEAILGEMPDPPEIIEGESVRATYAPTADRIQIPTRKRFESLEEFYLTLFHELIHATGHVKRLAREGVAGAPGQMGRDSYSFEELIAEIGASMLGAEAGIVRDDHASSADYIAGWLKTLRDPGNRRWIIDASRQARKAVEWVRGRAGT